MHRRSRRSRGALAWAFRGAAALALALPAGAGAAPGQPSWLSYVKGLEVRAVGSLRMTSKGTEVWYACVWGNKDAKRGFCESRDKGKTWTAHRSGFEDMPFERVPGRGPGGEAERRVVDRRGGGRGAGGVHDVNLPLSVRGHSVEPGGQAR